MESVVEKLKRVGLTEYEAKAYLALLNTHLNTATQVSEKSGVPRTKIYAVLEALRNKGWVHVYSGVPLLFKAIQPMRVFEKAKADYAEFLESIKVTLKEEVNSVCEKFVIKRFDVGLEVLKEAIKEAKTVEINNATTEFLNKVSGAFRQDAMVKVLLFPNETKPNNMRQAQFKQAEVAIVTIMRNKEVPSMSIILDETRTFTAFQDPVNHNYIIDEMLYDECSKCFGEWSNMGWSSATQA